MVVIEPCAAEYGIVGAVFIIGVVLLCGDFGIGADGVGVGVGFGGNDVFQLCAAVDGRHKIFAPRIHHHFCNHRQFKHLARFVVAESGNFGTHHFALNLIFGKRRRNAYREHPLRAVLKTNLRRITIDVVFGIANSINNLAHRMKHRAHHTHTCRHPNRKFWHCIIIAQCSPEWLRVVGLHFIERVFLKKQPCRTVCLATVAEILVGGDGEFEPLEVFILGENVAVAELLRELQNLFILAGGIQVFEPLQLA